MQRWSRGWGELVWVGVGTPALGLCHVVFPGGLRLWDVVGL